MAFTVKLFHKGGLSPAVTMLRKMHLELLSNNYTHPTFDSLNAQYNDPALVAYDGETPIGAMAYRFDPLIAGWFIMGSYVEPRWRRQGVHTLLFNTLVERARKRGDILVIASAADIKNKASQASQEKQGRKAVSIQYEYRIKDWEDPHDPMEVKPEA